MDKPTIQAQIEWVKDLLESIDGGTAIHILALPQESIMLNSIKETLKGDVKSATRIVEKINDGSIKQLASALDKAFQLIKFWHNIHYNNSGGSVHEDADHAFEMYLLQPEMKQICEAIVKHCEPACVGVRKEASHG